MKGLKMTSLNACPRHIPLEVNFLWAPAAIVISTMTGHTIHAPKTAQISVVTAAALTVDLGTTASASVLLSVIVASVTLDTLADHFVSITSKHVQTQVSLQVSLVLQEQP